MNRGFSSGAANYRKRSRRPAHACLLLLFAIIGEAVYMPLAARASGDMAPSSDQKRQDTYKINGHEFTVTDLVVAGIAGQVIIDRGMTGVRNAYFTVERDTFEEKTLSQMKPNPKKVLAIISPGNLFEDVTASNQIRRIYAEHRTYGQNKNLEIISVSGPQDLIAKLKALPQDGSFDRIEFMLHGNSGTLIFSDGTILASPDHPLYGTYAGNALEALEKANLRITQPGTEIRLTACVVARDLGTGKPVGKSFLNSLGKALLPEGGRVLASEKSIFMTRGIRFGEKLPIAGIILQARELVNHIKYLGIPKKLKPQLDVAVVDIAPSHPCKVVDSVRAILSQKAEPKH